MSECSNDAKTEEATTTASQASIDVSANGTRAAYLATPEDFMGKVMVHDIVKAVAEEFNVSFEDLQSKERARRVSRPRHIATYLARQWTTYSFPYIAFNTGKRDHSSAMNSYRVISAELQRHDSAELASVIESIKFRLDNAQRARHGLPALSKPAPASTADV